MEKAGREKKSVDGDYALGNYIAFELRSIDSPYWKDWAKLQMLYSRQNLIFAYKIHIQVHLCFLILGNH